MNDTTDRLIRCFTAVFPDVSPQQLETASPATVEGWDSVATVTLMSVIEEEFQIEIDPEDVEHLLSFSNSIAYVNKRLAATS